jgi:thiamine biosynthesis lipoprotein
MGDHFASRPDLLSVRTKAKQALSERLALACLMAASLFSTSFARKAEERRAITLNAPWITQTHYVMGTLLEVQVPGIASNEKVLASLFAIARHHDEVFSTFKTDSPVSRFNRSGVKGTPFSAPAEMIELVSLSRRFTEQTKGGFDITIGPLVRLWKEAAKRNQWPTREEVQAARTHVGGPLVMVDSRAETITALNDGVELDFNGIAKGYAVDKMVELLRGAGVTQAFINFGESSIYALGNDSDGRSWSIAVRDPHQPDRAALTLRLSDMALSTSGSYEHSSKVAGRVVNHIIDPRTGMPARNARAVTVVAPDATVAEALSKPLIVLPVGEGLKLLEGFPNTEAIIFYRSKSGHWKRAMSRGMKKFIE